MIISQSFPLVKCFFEFFLRFSFRPFGLSVSLFRSFSALSYHIITVCVCQELFLTFLHFFRRTRLCAVALSSACIYYHIIPQLSTLFLNFFVISYNGSSCFLVLMLYIPFFCLIIHNICDSEHIIHFQLII